MQGDTDYEAVAEQLQRVIDGEREASLALLKHARDAALAFLSVQSKYPGLRAGRPEHLTVEAAEAHADWLRAQGDNVTVVAKLLVIAIDELRAERDGVRREIALVPHPDANQIGPVLVPMMVSVPDKEIGLARKLLAIRFDEHGTPTTKLPSCWRCEEDELMCMSPSRHARVRIWKCLRCSWSFEHSALGPEATANA